jgi:hypothetical protein
MRKLAERLQKEDKRIYDAWISGFYKSLNDLANQEKKTRREIQLAIDRPSAA